MSSFPLTTSPSIAPESTDFQLVSSGPYTPLVVERTNQVGSQKIIPLERGALDLDSLNPLEGAKPIKVKELLKLVFQIAKSEGIGSETLSGLIEDKMASNPELKREYLEIVNLLNADTTTADKRIDELDELKKDWIIVERSIEEEEILQPATWQSYAYITGHTAWYVTKTTGSVAYFVIDRVILNGRILQIAAAVGGVASVVNLFGNPYLPLLQSVLMLILSK